MNRVLNMQLRYLPETATWQLQLYFQHFTNNSPAQELVEEVIVALGLNTKKLRHSRCADFYLLEWEHKWLE